MRATWTFALTVTALTLAVSAPAQVIEYYSTDAVGSVRLVTDQSGAVVERHDYLPFGEECTTGVCASNPGINTGQPLRFTGKERDAQIGLDYFGARYYRTNIGRFTTIDPVTTIQASLVDPQRWNQYAYGLNNPFRFRDPDGRSPTLVTAAWGAGIGGGIGFVGSVSSQLISSGTVNWQDAGAAAAGGAFAGFTAGLTLGLAPVLQGLGGVVVVGATSNVAGGMVTRQLDSQQVEPVNLGAMGVDAVTGAAGAVAGRAAAKPLATAAQAATMRASAEAAAGQAQLSRDLAKRSADLAASATSRETVVGTRVTNAVLPAGQAAVEKVREKQ